MWMSLANEGQRKKSKKSKFEGACHSVPEGKDRLARVRTPFPSDA